MLTYEMLRIAFKAFTSKRTRKLTLERIADMKQAYTPAAK